MPHSLDEFGNITLNLSDYNFLESIKHQSKIHKLCESIKKIESICYFSLDITFPNHS